MVAAMMTYRVFNQNNALVAVSTRELDDAAAGHGALPTHLANAAGTARRHDLVSRLRETLTVTDRRNKLAAARSLLALGDVDSVPMILEAAAGDEDEIAANVFRALAKRIEGVDSVRRAFANGDEDPATAGAIASIYSGTFDLTRDDADFLVEAIDAYLAGTRAWVKGMDRDEWRSDLYILVRALARASVPPLNDPRARAVLARVADSRADRDTKKEAKTLLDGSAK
jgi:hypothetical protein